MAEKAKIILIAAIGKNRELGKGPELVWKLSEDLARFRETTKGYPIIMGRKTFESIGRVLPKRVNIIVTRDVHYRHDGCVVVNSIERAIESAQNVGSEKIYVIGGGEIYKQALPFADELDLTLVDASDPDADVYFPAFEHEFKKISESDMHEEGGVQYRFTRFTR